MTSVHTRKKKAQARKGWILIAIATIAFLAIGAGAIALSLRERRTDVATGCPVDRFDAITAVLVDMTDTLDPVQAAALRNTLLKIRDATPKFGRLEIYTLAPVDVTTLSPVFAACSPGSAKDVDSSLYGNPDLADLIWKKKFGDKVEEIIGRIEKTPPEERSPILQAVKSVSVTAFGNPLARDTPVRKLILISDLIQNGPQLSMYREIPDLAAFRQSQLYADTRPGLRGANVELVIISRETKRNIQNARWRDFWIGYFESINSTVERWVKIEEY